MPAIIEITPETNISELVAALRERGDCGFDLLHAASTEEFHAGSLHFFAMSSEGGSWAAPTPARFCFVPPSFSHIPERPRQQAGGLIVANPEAAERAGQAHRFAKWLSPDEIATLIALDERAKKIAAVKAVFPGAEIVGSSHDPCDHG